MGIELGEITLTSIPAAYSHGRGQAATDARFAVDQQRAVLTIICEDKDTEDVVAEILGYASPGETVERHLPARHPRYQYLFAVEISGIRQGGQPIRVGSDGPTCGFAWLTIVFEGPKYPIAAEPTGYRQMRPMQDRSQFLASGKDTFLKFNDPATPAPFLKTEVAGDRGIFIQRATITYDWLFVPEAFVTDAFGMPQNIIALMGRVNNFPFVGRKPGELLMIAPELTPGTFPVRPALTGSRNGVSRFYHVGLRMELLIVPVVGTIYGHQCLPLPGDPQGRWAGGARVNRNDNTQSQPLYQSDDFDNAFKAIA